MGSVLSTRREAAFLQRCVAMKSIAVLPVSDLNSLEKCDAGAFVPTGVYLMDCYPVLRKWLNEVRCEQLPDGKVPGVAPQNEVPGRFKLMSDGSAGWADAIGIVPNELAKTYNCVDILAENYSAFKKWVCFTEGRANFSDKSPGIEIPTSASPPRQTLV